jgi:RNA polymerase primary sigma factor
VSGWYAGASPSRKNLAKLAEALGVEAAWLEHGTGDAPMDEAAVTAEIASLGWWFREQSPDGQRVLGEAASSSFNPTVGIIIREGGQNIRDSRRKGEKTVQANFRVERLRGEALEQFLAALHFDQLRPHIDAASKGKGKQAAVLRKALEKLQSSAELTLLRIEDVNGIGLLGEEYGEGNYSALVRNVMDTDKPEGAGGSHGLGKSTIQRASALGTVLFCSNLSEPEPGSADRQQRLVGRVSLPWHRIPDSNGDEEFAGPGWFGVPDPTRKGTARSIYAGTELCRRLRIDRPEQSGTTVLVVGAHDPSGQIDDPVKMATEISIAAAENFFAALIKRGEEPPIMSVSVQVVDVLPDGTEKVLHDEVVDPSVLMNPLVDLLHKDRELQTVDELQESGDVVRRTVELRVPKRLEEPNKHAPVTHDAVLLVRQASAEEMEHPYINSVVLVRGALMKVKKLKPSGLGAGVRPFFAMVLAGEAAATDTNDRFAELFLRMAEPPSHESWEVTSDIATFYDPRGVRKMLDDFLRQTLQVLREVVTVPLHETSNGPESLRELLRIKKPPEATQRPRVVAPVKGAPRSDGAWEVEEATVQLPPKSKGWLFTPVLKFAAETGGGIPVRWASIEPISGCTKVDDLQLRVAEGVRKAKWKGVTDPSSHPAAAADSVAVVDIIRPIEEA